MDDELKIVVTSVLEADEEESAQRISAQLPEISKKINARSSIKVGVSLNDTNIQTEAQRVAKSISKSLPTQDVGVKLHVTTDAKKMLKEALGSLEVDNNITNAMTKNLTNMQVEINKIHAGWVKVGKEKERLLQLTIAGTDQERRNVQIVQTYDESGRKVSEAMKDVTLDIQQLQKEQERAAAQAKADNESRVSYLTRQKSLLADIQATYTGATSTKPVTDEGHLKELNDSYNTLNTQIQSMISAEGRLDNVQRASLEEQIANLKRLVREYQNAEYVATKLRTKDISAVKADQLSNLDQFEQKLRDAGILTESFQKDITGLRNQINSAFNADAVTPFLNAFDDVKNRADTTIAKIAKINSLYKELGTVSGKISGIRQDLVGLDPEKDAEKIAALQKELELYQVQELAIGAQINSYGDLVALAQGRVGYEQQADIYVSKLKVTEGELADKARECDAAMARIPTTVSDLETRFRQVISPTDTLVQNMNLLREISTKYNTDMGDAEKVQTYERLQMLIGACSKEMSELMRVQRGDILDFKFTENLEKAKADLATIGRQWSALFGDKNLATRFTELGTALSQVSNADDLKRWTAMFGTFKSEVKAAGRNVLSLADTLRNNIGKVTQWISATTVLFRTFRALKEGLDRVVELDTAMIDLRKTTNETDAAYKEFYFSANKTAKQLGVTTQEVIAQTAEWSRLGYAMQDAAELAKNSAIFASVSPEMDISQATDGLVSVIKAFGIDVNDTLDGVISKINSVGNAFAVTNADIVEVLTRSSSAMAAANNTFEQTVALATSAIEITRDASSVGNALKTISMRIRGYDEETEEYSGSVAELTGKIADLTKTAKTPGGISLFENGDPNTYRSTYDILMDIADIWNDLTDKNRATLLEALFGKRQAQIGAAMLSNFEQARKSIETMANSAGSADREMEKIYQSLDYKLNALKETWTGVAQNLFDTDGMKIIVDGLNGVSSAVEWLTDKLGLLGTAAAGVSLFNIVKTIQSVGRPKMTGFVMIVPTYALVATRNECAV